MTRKRKRKHDAGSDLSNAKRPKLQQNIKNETHITKHPVLDCYYPRVQTLRQFILTTIPNISKRRKRLLKRTEPVPADAVAQADLNLEDAYRLLDNVLVGADVVKLPQSDKGGDFQQFTQQLSASTARSLFGQATASYAEIVDFVLWLLFYKIHVTAPKPPHVLCHGFSRASTLYQNGTACADGGIHGLVATYPNEHVETIRHSAWEALHKMLGKHGDSIMVDLLAHCAVFMPVDKATGTLYQLSGKPLSEMSVLQLRTCSVQTMSMKPFHDKKAPAEHRDMPRKLSEIRFVRHRMYYARPALNATGNVTLGLRHIHVLKRFPDAANRQHTIHIMKYLFPRQFDLHNVFTSNTNTKNTAQPFKDYTLREDEISRSAQYRSARKSMPNSAQLDRRFPKRLRNGCFELVQKMQRRHKRCSYAQLLDYYCVIPHGLARAQGHNEPTVVEPAAFLTAYASSAAQVSSFCCATIARIFPSDFFGDAATAQHNFRTLCREVDRFVHANRFETMSLETVMTGMKIDSKAWLMPYSQGDIKSRMSLSDFSKRKEVFSELIYYIFDSFLIPLIRFNFHVTESSTDKNKLFYFRHDVWKFLTEPKIAELKSTMLEEMGNINALKILNKRALGFSQIRLLPKGTTLRPISNLRRRAQVIKNGRIWLGKSINSVLAPAFSVLKCEKQLHPQKLGASMFSVTDIFPKLRTFRNKLAEQGSGRCPLYFAKIDVKACFDSLPQAELNALAQLLPSCSEYNIMAHTEIGPPEDYVHTKSAVTSGKPKRRFRRTAVEGYSQSFNAVALENALTKRPNTIFVDAVVPQRIDRQEVNELQSQHIGAHIVRIGKKYYRQKRGIPQGSVLSSLLCNFFFAEFEAKHLSFLDNGDCALLRLIDDFLLITTSKAMAERFVNVMHKGSPAHGITVKVEKTLVNFDMVIEGQRVASITAAGSFPYCGIYIDMQSLDINKNGSIPAQPRVSLKSGEHQAQGGTLSNVKDSLTVEYSNMPGQSFRRKMLSGLKIQFHTMLLDTTYNRSPTVLSNVYKVFADVAQKCFEYTKCLNKNCKILNIGLVQDIAALAFAMMKSNRNRLRHADYRCRVGKPVVHWLAATAFLGIFAEKSTRYGDLAKCLRRHQSRLRIGSLVEREQVMRAVATVDLH